MSTASIDFTLAAIAMIVVTLGAVFGVSMVVAPYLEGDVHGVERYQQIGRYILLSKGEPSGWGTGGIPNELGLAAGGSPYELDIDKVTRLNPDHPQSVNYSTLWQALGIDDVSFRISVEPLFNLILTMASSQVQGSDTVYTFSSTTVRDGYPLPCQVTYYIAVGNSTYSSSGSTALNGSGTVQFTLPNSSNGTAVLIGIARAEKSITSFDVLSFAHNTSQPNQPGAYASLSPLDYTLGVSLAGGASAWNAAVFSYGYSFNLTASGSDYIIPRLLAGGPMVVTLTGINGTDRWVEWVAYPQVPLEVGGDMEDDYVVSDVWVVEYVVEIEGGLYRYGMKFRSPAEYD
ncbi:MAG: hypothetical protein V3S09_03875 [Candidatus Bathyarchaeia archaeon]